MVISMVRKVKAAPTANTADFSSSQLVSPFVCARFAMAPIIRERNATTKNNLQKRQKVQDHFSTCCNSPMIRCMIR
jgi:hypothetical protein